ncbi:MAG: energy transducer TonB [Candidatus Acidiferrales bacterium]
MRTYAVTMAIAVLLGISCGALEHSTEQRTPEPRQDSSTEVEVTAAARVRSSSIKPGKLVHQVKPVYPPLAVTDRISGPVMLEGLIGKDGTIRELCLKGGHPKLVGATVEAVWQWKYEPTLLNGEPFEVQMVITVSFKLKDEKAS